MPSSSDVPYVLAPPAPGETDIAEGKRVTSRFGRLATLFALAGVVSLCLWATGTEAGAPVLRGTVGDVELGDVGIPLEHGELIREGVWCTARSWWIGQYESIGVCKEMVAAADGKYYSYGFGLFFGGNCYMHYTQSRNCSEGFTTALFSYSFYEIANVEESDWGSCEVDTVTMRLWEDGERNATEPVGLYTDDFLQRGNLPLLTQVSKVSSHGLWPKICQTAYRLECLEGYAEVAKKEACCELGFFSNSGYCDPPNELEEAGVVKKLSRTDSWSTCRYEDKKFELSAPPTHPPLPPPGSRPCFEVADVQERIPLRRVFNQCPQWVKGFLRVFSHLNDLSYKGIYSGLPSTIRNSPFAWVTHKSAVSSLLDPTVFDTYTIGMVVASIHIKLRNYKGRFEPPSKRITLPTKQELVDHYVVYDWVGTPVRDIDSMHTDWLDFATACVVDGLGEMIFKDAVTTGDNTWWRLLGGAGAPVRTCPYDKLNCTKKEYVMGVFAGYHTRDGDPVYPKEDVNFRGYFLGAGGRWSDEAERFLAFSHLGSHRLATVPSSGAPSQGGETAKFVVATSDLAGLYLRSQFGVPGADMFFSDSGLPLMIRRPDGHEIWRSEAQPETWQYWKFVWRSSLYLKVTLVDHLWGTHYGSANVIAASAREALQPNHALRRLLSIVSYGSIAVNDNSVHQLVHPRQLLHRSTPFSNFQQISEVAQSSVLSLEDRFGPFADGGIANEYQNVPYYADGQLLFAAFERMANKVVGLYSAEWCSADGIVLDPDIKAFFLRVSRWSDWKGRNKFMTAADRAWLGLDAPNGAITCAGLRKWLAVMMFAVTGYHRHVGQVGDIAADPDFASFSWKEGEAFGLPRQHLQMALISGTTATMWPKLIQDYTHLAEGTSKEADVRQIFADFGTDMAQVSDEVAQRNKQRAIPYAQMDPKEVECSVAV